MTDMTRLMAIKWLKRIKGMLLENSEEDKAIDMAIASLETDEAYQLEYEVSTQPSIDDFIEYAERKFGVKLYVKKSDIEQYIHKHTKEQTDEV